VILLLIIMLAAIFTGVPIAIALGLTGTAAVLLGTNIPMALVGARFVGGLEATTLMAIPFFIFAGVLMEVGGIARRIIAFAEALVGWVTGSLLMVATVTATGMAAICGSGSADAAAVSAMLGSDLRKRGYDMDFAAAQIAAAATLAQIIPPSIMLILVAVAGNLSTGTMLLSGIIPGILLMLALLASAYIHAKRHKFPSDSTINTFSLRAVLVTGAQAWAAWGMILIVVGGILTGAVTATEAAALSAAYALIVGVLVYREIDYGLFVRSVRRSAALSAAILMIVGSVSVLNWVISTLGMQSHIHQLIVSTVDGRVGFLILSMVILLLLGMFIESFAVILLITPVLMPLAIRYGVEPHHFGLLLVFNLCIGMITPPFAATLFATSTVLRRNIVDVSMKIVYPWLAMMIVLGLAMAFPDLSLYLPRLAGYVQ